MASIDPIRDARILAEAELLRARAGARSLVKQSLFQVVAVLLGVGGLLMLIVAGFLALSDAFGSLYAALLVGGVQFLLAVILIFVARPLSRSPELGAAERAAKQAREDLRSDTEALQSVVRVLSGDLSEWTSEKRLSILVAAFGAGIGLGIRTTPRKPRDGKESD
ncbi:MAG: phage holin family protein [Deltaproteobacteria bacterium]|nr:phage holin family protein [Deltaproteobacteria bacterium]